MTRSVCDSVVVAEWRRRIPALRHQERRGRVVGGHLRGS